MTPEEAMPTEKTLEERVREVMACGDFADVEDAVLALAQSEREAVRKQDAAAVCGRCENGEAVFPQGGQATVWLHHFKPPSTGFIICPASAIHELARAEKAAKSAAAYDNPNNPAEPGEEKS